MCSICRNPKCKYRFDVDRWGPPDEGLVTVQIPESDLTFPESVRIAEDNQKKLAGRKPLALPAKRKR